MEGGREGEMEKGSVGETGDPAPSEATCPCAAGDTGQKEARQKDSSVHCGLLPLQGKSETGQGSHAVSIRMQGLRPVGRPGPLGPTGSQQHQQATKPQKQETSLGRVALQTARLGPSPEHPPSAKGTPLRFSCGLKTMLSCGVAHGKRVHSPCSAGSGLGETKSAS